jgi:hypothetical protein
MKMILEGFAVFDANLCWCPQSWGLRVLWMKKWPKIRLSLGIHVFFLHFYFQVSALPMCWLIANFTCWIKCSHSLYRTSNRTVICVVRRKTIFPIQWLRFDLKLIKNCSQRILFSTYSTITHLIGQFRPIRFNIVLSLSVCSLKC